ncbi:MAG TPA: hypothetical protein PKZ42_13995 [Syntrophales bacterium]|nr:hypothetical protein [Syntrophales bacterium]
MNDLVFLESHIAFEVKSWEYEVSMNYDGDEYRKKREGYSKELRLLGLAEHITWFGKKRISELIVTLNEDDYEFLENDSGERLIVGHITRYDVGANDSTKDNDIEYEFKVRLKKNIFIELHQTLLNFSESLGRIEKKSHSSMFIKLPVIGFNLSKNTFYKIEPETWNDTKINLFITGFRFSLHMG